MTTNVRGNTSPSRCRSRTRGWRRIAVGRVCLGVVLGVASQFVAAQQQGPYKAEGETLPRKVGPQPVAFSHRLHSSVGMTCGDCHRTAATMDWAGLPTVEDCLLCHQGIATESPEIRKLEAMRGSGEKIVWTRVYDSPDFVFFSHKNHIAAELECQTCHGPVAQREVLMQEASIRMTACMNCHATSGVENHCQLCHSLGQ